MSQWGVSSTGTAVVVPDGWPAGIPYDGPAMGLSGSSYSSSGGPGGSSDLSSLMNLLNQYSGNSTQAAANEAAGNWSDLMGYVIATGQLPPPGALTSASQQAVGLIGPGQLPSTTEQGLTGISALGNPTLAGQQQYADLTGTLPSYLTGANNANGTNPLAGSPTLAAQTLQGFVGGLPTTQEQQVASQQIASIMAANNPANPFTYLSKLNNIGQLGDTSSLLRNAMQQITGYTTSQLSQQPTVSQASLLGSLYGGISGGPQTPPNTALGGQTIWQPRTMSPTGPNSVGASNPAMTGDNAPNSNIQQLMAYLHQSKPGSQDTAMDSNNTGMWGQLMSYLHNSKPTATPSYDSSGNITSWNPLQTGTGQQSANPLSAALPNLAANANTQSPNGPNFGLRIPGPVAGPSVAPSLSPGLLSGWGLSGQQMSKLAPSAQGAVYDYIQNQGGANPTDAAAATKQGMPSFNKSPFGTVGNAGQL